MTDEYKNEDAYLKEMQMDAFATMEKKEAFNEFDLKNDDFERDSNWKPLVTKEQVLVYSKENFWEE